MGHGGRRWDRVEAFFAIGLSSFFTCLVSLSAVPVIFGGGFFLF